MVEGHTQSDFSLLIDSSHKGGLGHDKEANKSSQTQLFHPLAPSSSEVKQDETVSCNRNDDSTEKVRRGCGTQLFHAPPAIAGLIPPSQPETKTVGGLPVAQAMTVFEPGLDLGTKTANQILVNALALAIQTSMEQQAQHGLQAAASGATGQSFVNADGSGGNEAATNSQMQAALLHQLQQLQQSTILSPQQTALLSQQQAQAQAILSQQQAVTHNLIPVHLQASALPPSMDGWPGYQPALIPSGMTTVPGIGGPANVIAGNNTGNNNEQQVITVALPSIPIPPVLTVQDRPMITPVYNGVNPNYPGLRVVNSNPPIFCVDNFLTPLECNFLVLVAQDSFGPAPVVGKGAGEISPSRTSSTCYLAREDVPDYLRKVSSLTGKPIEHCELPQVGRYLPTQQYLQHFDAFDLSNEDGRRFAANGGQRTITVLVYLNDVAQGGATRFPALNIDVQPRQGMALVFFPATVDGFLDKMALHAALPAVDPKFVSQVWIRQSNYNGQPSKRLSQTLGVPFGQESTASNLTNGGLAS